MKYGILILMTVFLSQNGLAQAGLVFSQCLTFSGNGPWIMSNFNPSDRISPQYTVPEGKVWKLEYAYVRANGTSVYLRVNGNYSAPLNTSITQFPIWFKSGDVIDVYIESNSAYNYDLFFSILEFNSN